MLLRAIRPIALFSPPLAYPSPTDVSRDVPQKGTMPIPKGLYENPNKNEGKRAWVVLGNTASNVEGNTTGNRAGNTKGCPRKSVEGHVGETQRLCIRFYRRPYESSRTSTSGIFTGHWGYPRTSVAGHVAETQGICMCFIGGHMNPRGFPQPASSATIGGTLGKVWQGM